MISTAKNSNKFQKTKSWKEKSIENVVTLGPMAHATLVYFERILRSKLKTILPKN